MCLFISLVANEEALVSSLLDRNMNMNFTREHMPRHMSRLSSVQSSRERGFPVEKRLLWQACDVGHEV